MATTSYSVNGSWVAPSFRNISGQCNATYCENLRIDCDVVTNYFVNSILVQSRENKLTDDQAGDVGYLTAWLKSLLPDEWKTEFTADQKDVLDSDLMLWYYGVWQSDRFANTNWTVYDEHDDELEAYDSILAISQTEAFSCDGRKICDKIEIRGDPDVSGRGMLMAYIILAVLATIYFLILTTDRMISQVYESRGGDARRQSWNRIVTAFRETVDDFLSAALIFAIALLGATIARDYMYLNRKNETQPADVWSYALQGSALTSIFSVFPCMVLQIVTTLVNATYQRYQRLFLWSTVISLAIAVGLLSQQAMGDLFTQNDTFHRLLSPEYDYSDWTDMKLYDSDVALWNESVSRAGVYRTMIWEQYCVSNDVTRELNTLVAAGFGVQAPYFLFCLLAIVAVLIPVLCPIRLASTPDEYVKNQYGMLHSQATRVMTHLRVLMGLVYLAMTWLFLAKFIIYRHLVKSLAPSTDQDSDWSFGQILALAQWVPVVISLLSIWRKNAPSVTTEEKVLHIYEAVDNSDQRYSRTSYKMPMR